MPHDPGNHRYESYFRGLRLFMAMLACLAVIGCGGRADDQQDRDTGANLPEAGGTAVIAIPVDPDVLNPLIRASATSGMVIPELFDTLVEFGEDLQWYPRIATSWELEPDGLALTYRLQPWLWSDGRPLTAYDVAASFDLYKDPVVASPQRGIYEDVLRAVALDSATVRYEFSRPLIDPLYRTSHQILPLHVTAELDPANVRSWPLNEAPISSGPFRLDRWQRNHELVLVANETYVGTAAYLERVVFRVIPEESARVVALETGEVDFVSDLGFAAAERLMANDDLRIEAVSGRQYYYLQWNCRLPEFADTTTRRALSLAIDRKLMIDNLTYGHGTPANSPIPPALWNHHTGLPAPPFDPEEARILLAKAGWLDVDGDGVLERDGRNLRLEILTRQGDSIREHSLVILREQLAAIGAEVVPRILEHATSLARLRSGDFSVYLGRFNSNLFGDPSGLIHSEAVDRFNFGAYANAEVDSLLGAALAMPARQEALPVWQRLQEVLIEDPPAAYLFYQGVLVGTSGRLRDVRPHLLSPINNLAEWWIPLGDRRYRTH